MDRLSVLEFEGLAPSVLCGLFFADLGAEVTIVARHQPQNFSIPIDENIMNRNKKCICLDLKSQSSSEILKILLKTTDIVIDPFRPGVLEKIGFGPQAMWQVNPRIILLRVSGFGQTGEHAHRPGHDLNYIGMAGVLSKFGQQEKAQFPNNFVADFAGCMLGITGTMAALLEREKTGLGQVVDCSLMNCARYLGLPLSDHRENQVVRKYQDDKGIEYISSFLTKKEADDFDIKMKDSKDYAAAAKNSLCFTEVLKVEQLTTTTSPIDYFKEGLIMPAKNVIGFEFTSPFTKIRLNRPAPSRGEHTESYLKEKNVPQRLVEAALKAPKSKL